MAFRDGQLSLVFGTPGGDVQVQAMVQLLVNHFVHGLDVQAAIEAPRVATFSFPSSFSPFEAHPGLVGVEARIEDDVRVGLEHRGHHVERWPDWTRQAGALCAIARAPDTDCLHAGADPRRAAYAMGR